MVGWHYTTWTNWLKIKEEGLVPYTLERDFFKPLGFTSITAVWVWTNRAHGKSHLGNIIYQMAKKGEDAIVLLAVHYAEEEKWHNDVGQSANLFHQGSIGTYVYHTKDCAILLTQRIPPERVCLVRKYCLLETLQIFDETLDKRGTEEGEENGFRFNCSGRNVITRNEGSVTEPHSIEATEAVSGSR